METLKLKNSKVDYFNIFSVNTSLNFRLAERTAAKNDPWQIQKVR